jgi:ubiquinone/menaquinone biosynthesis C-methylase UbiE
MSKRQYHDPAEQNHHEARQFHWDTVARKRDSWRGMGIWYHHRIEQIYRFLISPGQCVLEIGSGTGDLLATVQPASGIGIDFSAEQIVRAKERHPEIEFIQADAHDLSVIKQTFDVIILSDLVNELWD